MEWTKTPEAVARAFDDALPLDPRVERRKMFGYPAAFVGGNMFASTFGAEIILRLAEADRTEAVAAGGSPFAPMGRPMTGFVVAPPDAVATPDRLEQWLARAFAHGSAMPPKEKKKPAVKRAPKGRPAV